MFESIKMFIISKTPLLRILCKVTAAKENLCGRGAVLWPQNIGGEDGIRTHVGLLPNGFQDRLVMTASIPLRIVDCDA